MAVYMVSLLLGTMTAHSSMNALTNKKQELLHHYSLIFYTRMV